MAVSSRLAAVEQCWQAWAALGTSLSGEQWARPSRCPGWTTAGVFAHHSVTPHLLTGDLPTESVPGDPVDAVTMLRGFNEPGGLAETAAPSIESDAATRADELPTTELVRRFTEDAPRALANLRTLDPDMVIPWLYTGVLIRVSEGLRLILLEATVHLLDACHAAGVPATAPEPALRETARFLAEVAPPVEFLEAATGRIPGSPFPIIR
ncbi:maleylpyruvate isomerase family mycothiol-dependent enzyme [Pseudonocardiaceae bacterium YIM PH 21723]|nr:maleylpyruvate isomerase family mycothiol-dependent enzyme [Pseudonocardiaceae bacterium YIM PH 21723]